MEVWAHRGTNVGVEENTLEAFRKALKYGPWGLELDVRLCGSGEVIVFHDPTLWRITRSFDIVEDLSLDELRRQVPYYVPTLSEFMKEFSDKARLCIDVKGTKVGSYELEKSVVDAVKGINPSRYEFSSKSILSLAKLYKLSKGARFLDDPKWPVPKITLVLGNPKKLKLRHRFLHIDNVSISDKFITKIPHGRTMFRSNNPIRVLKKKGYRVRVYPVNDPTRAQVLTLMGADGIFTDHISKMNKKIISNQS